MSSLHARSRRSGSARCSTRTALRLNWTRRLRKTILSVLLGGRCEEKEHRKREAKKNEPLYLELLQKHRAGFAAAKGKRLCLERSIRGRGPHRLLLGEDSVLRDTVLEQVGFSLLRNFTNLEWKEMVRIEGANNVLIENCRFVAKPSCRVAILMSPQEGSATREN